MYKRICLCASLLVVFISACTSTSGTHNSPSQELIKQATSQPEDTSTLALKTNQPPTNAPVYTKPYTSQPSITEPTFTLTPPAATVTPQTVVFTAIGDYGSGDQAEADVASLIETWQPDFIITLGDNNYPEGAADTMDYAVGQFFHAYIYPYKGSFGDGADENRFFPTLGNHDIETGDGKPYYDYFTLPGNERYYDFTWGFLHFFVVNSNGNEPDGGVASTSKQYAWLKDGLSTSRSTWNIVTMHDPAYSSGMHGSTDWMRWPYAEWGADVVMAGHDHTYERLEQNGIPYFVNGLGGGGRYDFSEILPGSMARYNNDYGALRVEATERKIKFEFITRTGEMIDAYVLTK